MKLLPYEIWRDIPGYEGVYQASNMGNIRSVRRYVHHYKGGSKLVKERILKTSVRTTGHSGYKQVVVCLGLGEKGKHKTEIVARLVALAFIPNPENLPEMNHKDENSLNNIWTNLEWCNGNYNKNYGTRNERISKKMTNHKMLSKQVVQLDFDGNVIAEYPSISEVERVLGYNNSAISRCYRGGRPTAYGFVWRYL